MKDLAKQNVISSSGLALAALLFIASIILVNSAITNLRVDLTENKLFTLSEGTKNILAKLEEPVILDFYYSRQDMVDFPLMASYSLRVRDMLEEYEAHANGMIDLNIIEPETFSEEEDQAVASGLQNVTASAASNRVYFGLVGSNSTDDERVIPFFQASKEQALEYDLTKLIYNLAYPDRRVVGVLGSLPLFGDGEEKPTWTIINAMREFFDVRDLGKKVKTEIDSDVDLLLVVHPKDFDDATIYALDQYLIKGGKAMVFLDPLAEQDQQQPAPGTQVLPIMESHLEKLLRQWGLEVTKGKLIGDLKSAMRVQARGPRGMQQIDYLPWLRLSEDNFKSDDFSTSELNLVHWGNAGEIKGNQAIVVFKGQSIYYVGNLVPNSAGDYTAAFLDELSSRHGLLARNSVVQVGKDLFYLSTEQGITSVKLTEENNLKPGVEHLSEAMEETLSRVNWGAAVNCQAETWDDFIYFALPLDDAWILADDLVEDQALEYGGAQPYTATVTGLTVGQKYLATFGEAEFSLTDGATVYHGTVEFVAQNTSVTLETLDSGRPAVGCTIQAIEHENVNTGVLVFDTVNKAWAGVDEADRVIAVKRWLKAVWQGRERLFYLSNDGFIRLYEEGFHDEKLATGLTPFADLFVYQPPADGNTIQVNSGDVLTASSTAIFNTSTLWRTGALSVPAVSAAGLALYFYTSYGFGEAEDTGGTKWSAPNTTVTQIGDGVRFTATNGVTPSISIVGDWGLVDAHGSAEVRAYDIETEITSRGYLAADPDSKRWQSLDLMLATWSPSYTVTTITDGVNEETAEISDQTFDRAEFHTRAADYDTDNDNDDHAASRRKDYSVVIPDLGFDLGAAGVAFDLHQEFQERIRLDNHRGRTLRVKITNTAGRCVIRQIDVAAQSGQKRAGIAI